jgi:PilZ domain-containing protein
MQRTVGDGLRLVQHLELEQWLIRARRHWSPIIAAGTLFNALIDEGRRPPVRADFDEFYEVSDLAIRWLEDNPCPDQALGGHLRAQLIGYRDVADTVQSTFTADDDVAVAQLGRLRDVVDHHGVAIDEMAPSPTKLVPGDVPGDVGVDLRSPDQWRRRVPRQPVGWDGSCLAPDEPTARWRECRIFDISMLGLGLSLNHPSPSQLLGRHIFVDVPATSDSVRIRLEGVVTNAEPTLGGTVRVGITFEGSSEQAVGKPAVANAISASI